MSTAEALMRNMVKRNILMVQKERREGVGRGISPAYVVYWKR